MLTSSFYGLPYGRSRVNLAKSHDVNTRVHFRYRIAAQRWNTVRVWCRTTKILPLAKCLRKRVICYDAARELGTLVSSSFRPHFFTSDNLLTLLSIVSFIGYHSCQDSLNSLVSWHIFSLANSVGPIQNHSTSKVRITFTTWFP